MKGNINMIKKIQRQQRQNLDKNKAKISKEVHFHLSLFLFGKRRENLIVWPISQSISKKERRK